MSKKNCLAKVDVKNQGQLTVFYELGGFYVYLDDSQLQSNGFELNRPARIYAYFLRFPIQHRS